MSGGLRAPTEDDLPELVRVMSQGRPEPVQTDDVRLVWSSPGFDVASDARLDGDSYAQLEDLGEGRIWIDVRGHPSEAILDWAEERASAKGHRLISGSWSSNEALLRKLERRGYTLVRHSHRMAIDLGDWTPDPAWPDGIEVRSFRPGDERAFYEAQQETFADSWEPVEETFENWSHWLLETPSFDPELWFRALDGAETAGFAICQPRSGDPETGSVRLLGVRRPWRKRGLGRALLLRAFAELRRRGFRRAGLGVDAESLTGAHKLYESAGMHVEARFDVYEKPAA
jgi:ribosomal protein S18 acetylase RimI-like enzyme